jgi:hypothetical protein
MWSANPDNGARKNATQLNGQSYGAAAPARRKLIA